MAGLLWGYNHLKLSTIKQLKRVQVLDKALFFWGVPMIVIFGVIITHAWPYSDPATSLISSQGQTDCMSISSISILK
jgi:hypothetical protein